MMHPDLEGLSRERRALIAKRKKQAQAEQGQRILFIAFLTGFVPWCLMRTLEGLHEFYPYVAPLGFWRCQAIYFLFMFLILSVRELVKP